MVETSTRRSASSLRLRAAAAAASASSAAFLRCVRVWVVWLGVGVGLFGVRWAAEMAAVVPRPWLSRRTQKQQPAAEKHHASRHALCTAHSAAKSTPTHREGTQQRGKENTAQSPPQSPVPPSAPWPPPPPPSPSLFQRSPHARAQRPRPPGARTRPHPRVRWGAPTPATPQSAAPEHRKKKSVPND